MDLKKHKKILSTLGFTVFFNLFFIVVNKTSEKLENSVQELGKHRNKYDAYYFF